MHLKGYGCAGRCAVEYGLAAMELEAGDSGIRTFVSVQGSLAMSAISKFGSEEHKQRWLPGMAAGELIGCFGLTEPTAGSDPASMVTRAVRDGDVGAHRGQAVDRAGLDRRRGDHLGEDRRRRSEASSSRPTPRASPPPRSSQSCRCARRSSATSPSTGCGCPRDAVLPGVSGLKGPFSCLNEARYGIMWGAMGAARDAYETRPALRAGSAAVRHADRVVPADPAEAGRHGAGDPEGGAGRAADRPAQGRRASCARSRSPSASSTTSAKPSRSAGPPARSSAATASPSTTRRCATPTTWRACAPTRAPTRSTR